MKLCCAWGQQLGRQLPWAAATWSAYPSILLAYLVLCSAPSLPVLLRFLIASGFNVLLFALLLALLGGLPRVVQRPLLGLWWGFIALHALLSCYHFLLYQQLMGLASVYALLETSGHEAAAYLYDVFNYFFVAVSLVLVAPLLVAARQPLPRWPAGTGRRARLAQGLLGALALAALLAGFNKPFIWGNNPFLFAARSGRDAFAERQRTEQYYASLPAGVAAVAADAGPATHVLVIGESTVRGHLSLYGYGRETSPRLTALRPELLLAQDACSSRGTTIFALKEMLTFATRSQPELLYSKPNLLQIMAGAGFRTYWISNQQHVGEHDSWSGIFAGSAASRLFLNKRGWENGVGLDETVLPPYRAILADGAPRRFIVIHLIGAHAAYDVRYPRSFSHFSGEGGVDPRLLAKLSTFDKLRPGSYLYQYNAYDNAVRYNDHVVAELLESLRGQGRVTLTYLSDHGESLAETTSFIGHFDGPGPRQMYEIPLLFHLSPEYAPADSPLRQQLTANLTRPFQGDQLIHTLLDLYRINYPDLDRHQSLAAAEFTPRQRYCDQLQ